MANKKIIKTNDKQKESIRLMNLKINAITVSLNGAKNEQIAFMMALINGADVDQSKKYVFDDDLNIIEHG